MEIVVSSHPTESFQTIAGYVRHQKWTALVVLTKMNKSILRNGVMTDELKSLKSFYVMAVECVLKIFQFSFLFARCILKNTVKYSIYNKIHFS